MLFPSLFIIMIIRICLLLTKSMSPYCLDDGEVNSNFRNLEIDGHFKFNKFGLIAKSKAVLIIFPKSRKTYQYPLSKRVCKRLSRVVAIIIELYSELRVEWKALSLRRCIAQFDP